MNYIRNIQYGNVFKSNTTLSTHHSISSSDYSQVGLSTLLQFLIKADHAIKILVLIEHLIYFVFVLFIKRLQLRSLILLHNVNLIHLLISAHYVLIINQKSSDFGYKTVDENLCRVSVFIWGLLKFQRSHSLLLLSFQRLIAVYKASLFKKLTNSTLCIFSAILFTWLAALLTFLFTKYMFSTTYGYIYCLDGFSKNQMNSILYFIINSAISIVLPTLAVLVFYFLIIKRLKMISASVNKIREDENKKAHQFLIMNILIALSSFIGIFNGIKNLSVFSFNTYFISTVSILNSLSLSIIPVVSTAFNPHICKWCNKKFYRVNSSKRRSTLKR
jgi:hypothetical protein